MKRILTYFDLKLIAVISMTLDHIGRMILLFFPTNESLSILSYILTIFGRLAFPIFLFLVIEGFYHTKNIKLYFLRLGIMALIVYLGLLTLSLVSIDSLNFEPLKIGNIFIDLTLALLFVYLINKKGRLYKLLLIPLIGYFVIFLLLQINIFSINNSLLKALVSGLAPQYSFVTPLFLVIFFVITFSYNFYDIKKLNIVDKNDLNYAYTPSVIKREYIYSFAVIILILILYALTYVEGLNLNTDLALDTYFIFAIIPVILYNGGIGKNSKIIQGAFYLYYPISICIIYLVFYLISLI